MARTITALFAATCLSATLAGTALANPASDRPVDGQTTALAAGAAVTQVNPDKDRSRKQGTLYDRVGGIFAIAAVVDRLVGTRATQQSCEGSSSTFERWSLQLGAT